MLFAMRSSISNVHATRAGAIMTPIRLNVPDRVHINVDHHVNSPIHSIHGECLREVSDSIVVIGCPYYGPAGLVSTKKDTSSIYK